MGDAIPVLRLSTAQSVWRRAATSVPLPLFRFLLWANVELTICSPLRSGLQPRQFLFNCTPALPISPAPASSY